MARSKAGMNEAAEAAVGVPTPAASTPSDEFTVIGGTHNAEAPARAPEVAKAPDRPVAGSVRRGEDKYREVYGQGGWLRQDEEPNPRIPGGGVLLHGFRKHLATLTPEEIETVKQQAAAAGSAREVSWNEEETKPRGAGSSRGGGRAPREIDPDANYKKNLKDRFDARGGQGSPEKSRKQILMDTVQHATLLNDHLNEKLHHVDESHSMYGAKNEAQVLVGQAFNHIRLVEKLDKDRKQGQSNAELLEATRKLRQAHAKISGDDFVAGTGTPAPNLNKDLMKNEAHADVELTRPTVKAPKGVRLAGNLISTSDPDYIEAVRRIKEGIKHPDPKVRMQFKNLNPQALAKMIKSTQGTPRGRQYDSETGDSPMTPGTPRLGAPAAQPPSGGGAPVSFREEGVPRPGDRVSTEGLGPAPKKRRLPVSWNREGNAVVNGKVFIHPQTNKPVNLGSFPSVQEAIKHIESNSELPNQIKAPTELEITPPGGRKPVKPNKNAVKRTPEKGPTATQKNRAAELAKEAADKKARLAERRATRPAPAAEPAPPSEDEQIAARVMDNIKKDLAAGRIPKRKKMPGEGTVNG